jgi:hypothetical protein
MRPIFILPFVWLAVVIPGFGALVPEVEVTTTNLDLQNYSFLVSTNAAQDGLAFHVVITSKTRNIPANSSVNLEGVTDWDVFADMGKRRQMGRASPPVKVTLKKNKRVWEADFMLPRLQFQESRLFCLFAEGYDGETGGVIDEKTVTFYEIRIQDFVNPSMTFYQPKPITREELIAMWKHETNWMSRMPTNEVAWYAANPDRMAQTSALRTPHYYYMGTGKKYGYDYVANLSGGSHGQGGYGWSVVLSGELQIENRHPFSDSFSEWQEIDMSKQ